jgi:hypothetical protein
MHIRTPWWIDVLFVAALSFGVYQAAINREEIGDWWYFRSYSPSAEVVKLADDAGMSERGRRLFYRADPHLVTSSEIASQCEVENLGCITEEGKIFILRVESDEDYDKMVVTAAHEMLHMAYRRLEQKKDEVNGLLRAEVDRLNDARLNRLLSSAADDEEFYDEAHSYLGSEYASLLEETEDHYAGFFEDRSRVVAAAERSRR